MDETKEMFLDIFKYEYHVHHFTVDAALFKECACKGGGNIMKISTTNRNFFYVEPQNASETDFWELANSGKWEGKTYEIFDHFIDKYHTYMDIGAWIGPTVLHGAQSAKHCYAVEPDYVAHGHLIKNIGLNPQLEDKITVFNGCISDKSGKVSFGTQSEYGDSMSSMLFGAGENAVIVDALSFGDFIEKYDIEDCNFIKMDIEGGEIIVLPAMKKYLEENKPTLHLSLHPFWFKNAEKDSKKIIDAIRIYDNIFIGKGKTITPENLYSDYLIKGQICDVVATDGSWQ